MNLKTLYISVISKSGVETPDGFFSSFPKETEAVEIPDSLAYEILTRLKTADESRKDPQVMQFYNDLFEKSFNEDLERALAQYKFDPDTLLEIKAQPTPGKKALLSMAKVKGLEDNQYNNRELQKKIENLEKAISGKPVNHELVNAFNESRQQLDNSILMDQAIANDPALQEFYQPPHTSS